MKCLALCSLKCDSTTRFGMILNTKKILKAVKARRRYTGGSDTPAVQIHRRFRYTGGSDTPAFEFGDEPRFQGRRTVSFAVVYIK
jgi:hypothetical protein